MSATIYSLANAFRHHLNRSRRGERVYTFWNATGRVVIWTLERKVIAARLPQTTDATTTGYLLIRQPAGTNPKMVFKRLNMLLIQYKLGNLESVDRTWYWRRQELELEESRPEIWRGRKIFKLAEYHQAKTDNSIFARMKAIFSLYGLNYGSTGQPSV